MDENLRIAVRVELIAGTFQFFAKLEEIEDAAVEDDADLPVVGNHGLVTSLTEVDDGQPPVGEANLESVYAPVIGAFAIGAAAAQLGEHRRQDGGDMLRRLRSQVTSDSAHVSRERQLRRAFRDSSLHNPIGLLN